MILHTPNPSNEKMIAIIPAHRAALKFILVCVLKFIFLISMTLCIIPNEFISNPIDKTRNIVTKRKL
ncbi:hypothetical protein J19TS1_39810 [Heyndrickxia oleronia]|nr:hypothetical protein J19TS1_39810 [Heyndrickxia oleronia]